MLARAEGEASRFGQLLTEYEAAPEVTRERLYIETMEHILSDTTKVILDVDGGNSMMYLPIDQIVRQSVEASDRRAVRQLSEPPTAEVPRSESQSMESATRSRDSVARDRRTR